MRIGILLFLFLSAIGQIAIGSSTNGERENGISFTLSGQQINPGVSDSFFNVVRYRYESPQKVVYQSYDSIAVEPEKVIFNVDYDSMAKQFTGVWKSFSTDRLIQIGQFDSTGMANGEFKFISYKDTSICSYSNGLKIGIQFCNYGDIVIQSSYLMDLKNGIEIVYKNQICSSVANYSDGQLNGSVLIFEIDELQRVYLYKRSIYSANKIRNGFNYSYHPNGNILAKRYYWRGKVLGKVKIYDEDGKFVKKVTNSSCIYY